MKISSLDVSRKIVAEIYEILSTDVNPEANAALDKWVAEFQEIHGELEKKRSINRGKLGKLFGLSSDLDLPRVLFAVEATLAIRMRLLAAVAVSEASDSPVSETELIEDALEGEVELIRRAGIQEYELPESYHALAQRLLKSDQHSLIELALGIRDEFEPDRLTCEDWYESHYSALIPKEARHALGSYYTPAWLVDHVIDSALSEYDTSVPLAELTVIDPAAGSGAFLLGWVRVILREVQQGQVSPQDALDSLTRRLAGVDVNPLAVLAAKSNLIAAAAKLMRRGAVIDSSERFKVILADGLSLDAASIGGDGAEGYNLVLGNPPWVNWEYMPREFRAKHQDLWPRLGLFSLRGRDKSFSKEDVSSLFFHYAVASYMKPTGRCAMVLPQSLFKASLNARGFRKMRLEEPRRDITLLRIDDFVDVRPFEGVANRTAVVYAGSGRKTSYPVPYHVWARRERGSRGRSRKATESVGELDSRLHYAQPPELGPEEPWVTGPLEVLSLGYELSGPSAYRARTGLFTGGANAVYHLRVMQELPNGMLRVRNVVERAKRVAPQVEADLEDTFVYPFLRGREVEEWQAKGELQVLLPHTPRSRMKPVPERQLKEEAPQTLSYLSQFTELLAERKGFTAWERENLRDGFYAVQRVGDYTFSHHKVVWRYISPRFISAVIPESDKPVIPNEKLMLIDCASAEEAYFVCGLLSSSVVRVNIESRMVSTQIAPHLIENVRIPIWDPADPAHVQISRACQEGHELRAAGNDYRTALATVDAAAARIFELKSDVALSARSYLDSSG
ncbi:N-6 DNA methylase [Streptomyces rubiginosohelvolus]|uniref:N-6 DNA methylase n=1 Tax=Streptomyces TaxID=1883 RepID=UPI00117BECF0|nr:N-6 DNA methylase [Streptomyces sp. gb14]